MMRVISLVLICSTGLFAGEFSRSEKKEMKKMLDGTLYSRVDMPCATGRHTYGTYKRPLVEISPDGVNTDADETVNASWWHADSTYWGVSVNMALKLDDLDVDDDGIEIELEGVDDDDISTTIKFVNVSSMADFKACFEKAFARKPLQEEQDWPQKIKDAIAKRQLVNGMTKRQAFYVTGQPVSFEKSNKGGREVEVWKLRQNKGIKMGYFSTSVHESTGLPAQIKFVGGKLVEAPQTGTGDDFSLE